jgi:hypothetical protein
MATVAVIVLAPDGAGKAVLNYIHAGAGPGGIDCYGQAAHLSDPDNIAHVAKVIDAQPPVASHGLVIRQPPPNVDTGMLSVPASAADAVVGDVWGKSLYVANQTAFTQWITVTDAAGTGIYANQKQIAPNDAWLLPLGDVKITGGVRWMASAVSAVQAQFVGNQ